MKKIANVGWKPVRVDEVNFLNQIYTFFDENRYMFIIM